MKKKLALIIVMLLLLFGILAESQAATMNDYCQAPPFVGSTISPNVLMVIDASGSMSWCAYNPTAVGNFCCNSDGGCGWTYTGNEEGYFDPTKVYGYNSGSDYWEETIGAVKACPKRMSSIITTNKYQGSCLNFIYMSRTDIVRWAMTGGNPNSCTETSTFRNDYCDPELWGEPGNANKVGSACNDIIGGCILRSSLGAPTRVKVPWSRVYDGLVFQFQNFSLRPRIGAMFYSGSGVRSEKVYIGDFTSPASTKDQFPFMNLITHINSTAPAGSTPTGPAMWDAFNYYKQSSPKYGGFTPQTGKGDKWRNPMYSCAQGGENCVYIPCAKNYVILTSDGQWNTPSCNIDIGYEMASSDPVVPAYKMHMGFTNQGSGADTSVGGVYSIGLWLGGTGEQSMKNVAMYGSFDTTGRTWPDNLSGYPDNTCTMTDCGSGKGSGCEPLPVSSLDWDNNADGQPDTFYNASDASGIKQTIFSAILSILRRATAGTAASVLASGEGQGANLLQAVFYPKRSFGNDEIAWTSTLQNLWYHVDPFFTNSTIREETTADGVLNLTNDYIAQFYFDTGTQTTRVRRCIDTDGDGKGDEDGDGACDNPASTIDLENLNNIWEAGVELWKRSSARTIKTTIGSGLIDFSTANISTLRDYLQALNNDEAEAVIRYVNGEDNPVVSGFTYNYRGRTVAVDLNKDGDTSDAGESAKVWKLGDILNSTPKIVSWTRLNTYDSRYNDTTYKSYIDSANYQDRGMVFAGGNDGMLHAFKLGKLEFSGAWKDSTTKKAKLTNPDLTTPLGHEVWAFIPKNALPYLKYTADPDYCHVYTVDLTPYIFDASIGAPGTGDVSNNTKTVNDWRTVLIGGMRFGGACRNLGSTCTDCVKTPVADLGYSSYFALDVTDQNNPILLWEFSNPQLGFATTGPSVVRISARTDGAPDNTKNGKFYVVFGSGPTGPISGMQFMARSDQDIRLFVLDLKTGALLRTINTGIQYGFIGSMLNTQTDPDADYQDDALHIGYVKRTGTNPNYTWTDGGIGRLVTSEYPDPSDTSKWMWRSVIDGIGPVTASVARLQKNKECYTNTGAGMVEGCLWLFFGTGRYYYTQDDQDTQRRIYGVKEPCIKSVGSDTIGIDPDCTNTVSELTNVTSINDVPSEATANSVGFKGWYINLDASTASVGAERMVPSPSTITSGAVFFTSMKPYTDICAVGSDSFIWAIKYNTGGSCASTLKGTILLQTSTAAIKEMSISTAFTEKDGRRTSGEPGASAPEPPPIFVGGAPVKRTIHMMER